MEKFDIVWVNVPFRQDASKSKQRPIVFLKLNSTNSNDVLYVTSVEHPEFLQYSPKNYAGTGLSKKSYIDLNRVYELSDKIMNNAKVIGHLSDIDVADLTKTLKETGLFTEKYASRRFKRRRIEESLVEIHNELNPVLWNSDGQLKEEVRDKIFELVEEFQDNLDIPLNILDIEFVGSNASYNYTKNSDVDVHIITDFSSYGYPEELVSAAMNAFKTNFNKSYDIDYKGYNVEIYIEDVNSQPVSNGIYSILRDEWIKEPNPLEPIEVDLEPELSEYRRRIDDALKDGNREDIQAIIDELYILRRNSVATEGEFGKGNLIFKQIRNDGLLDGLKNKKTDIKSKELSLEGLLESLSLLEKFEPKLYRADFVYDDNGAVKKDYAFVIQPKSTITVTKENAFSTDVIGAKNMERFKGCKIVRFAETTKNDVLKNPDKLVTKINRELRRDTRKSVQDWVSSGEVVDVAGNPVNLKPKEYATHHRNGNELITSDKKFITVIPRMGSKQKENMVHGILEIMDAENTDMLRFPVYFSDDARDKLKEHTVEVRLV